MPSMANPSRPLDGITVVSLEQAIAATRDSMELAEQLTAGCRGRG